jgi:hypothetical protein
MISFGASDGLLGFRTGAFGLGPRCASLGARCASLGARSLGLGARRVGLGPRRVSLGSCCLGFSASKIGVGAGAGRQLVADDACLASDLTAQLLGDLVAEPVGKCIQSALELFVKGQGRCRNYEVGCTPESSIESRTTLTG